MIDYAKPLINIEYMTRMVSDLCLNRDYKNAQNILAELNTELRLLGQTLTIMQEEQDKIERAHVRF